MTYEFDLELKDGEDLGEFFFSPIAPQAGDVIELSEGEYVVLHRKFSNEGVTLIVRQEGGVVLA
jgi:hypothetical protein